MIAVAAVLLVGCVVGGLGFALGRDSAESAEAERRDRVARTAAVARARKAGYEHGLAAGSRAAARDRQADGADREAAPGGQDVLATDGVAYDPGAFYIVEFASPAAGGELRISHSAPMEAGHAYRLCDAYDVCQAPR